MVGIELEEFPLEARMGHRVTLGRAPAGRSSGRSATWSS
jgi:hypothetical protein